MKQMIKKYLLVIILGMALWFCGRECLAEETEVTVSVADETGEAVLIQKPVSVTDADGDGILTINDALLCAHALYFPKESGEGYAWSTGPYGIQMDRLWGVENGGAYGYCRNNAPAMSLSDTIGDGDFIYAYVYTDMVAFSDTYSFFEQPVLEGRVGEELTLTLRTQEYDAEWMPVTPPARDFRIILNGKETEYSTDVEGNAVLLFAEGGDYVVSAYCEGRTIVPPTCLVHIEGKETVSVRKLSDGILARLCTRCDADNPQDWLDHAADLDGDLPLEWYILALLKGGGECSFTKFSEQYAAMVQKDTAATANATWLNRRLTCVLLGGGAPSEEDVRLHVADKDVLSLVYALHLSANTGKCYAVPAQLLALQGEDGGWCVRGGAGDPDVTAMAVQALAKYCGEDDEAAGAVDKAVAFLVSKQCENGEFQSYGIENCESTCQVIIALASLGIDCRTDERFIRDGRNLLDVLCGYRNEDGSFSHTKNAPESEMATAEALCAFIACLRLEEGKKGLYYPDKEPVIQPDGKENADGTPDGRDTVSPTPSAEKSVAVNGKSGRKGWRLPATVAVLAVMLISCLILGCLKRLNRKRCIGILLLGGLLIAAVWFLRFESTEKHYSQTGSEETIGTVSVTVRCDNLIGEEGVPSDGILVKTNYAITENDTVFLVLSNVLKAARISLDYSGRGESVYIKGIAGLYEMDFGEQSGWLYRVNGEIPSVSCGGQTVHTGDTIEFIYTRNGGEDIR